MSFKFTTSAASVVRICYPYPKALWQHDLLIDILFLLTRKFVLPRSLKIAMARRLTLSMSEWLVSLLGRSIEEPMRNSPWFLLMAIVSHAAGKVSETRKQM